VHSVVLQYHDTIYACSVLRGDDGEVPAIGVYRVYLRITMEGSRWKCLMQSSALFTGSLPADLPMPRDTSSHGAVCGDVLYIVHAAHTVIALILHRLKSFSAFLSGTSYVPAACMPLHYLCVMPFSLRVVHFVQNSAISVLPVYSLCIADSLASFCKAGSAVG